MRARAHFEASGRPPAARPARAPAQEDPRCGLPRLQLHRISGFLVRETQAILNVPSLRVLSLAVEMEGNRRTSQVEVHAAIVINRQINRMSTEMVRKSVEMGEDREPPSNKDFTPSRGLTTDEANDLLRKWGRNELLEKSTPTWLVIFRLVHFHSFRMLASLKPAD